MTTPAARGSRLSSGRRFFGHRSAGRHRAGRRFSWRIARRMLVVAGIIAIAVTVALVATGGSYALWNGTAVVNASTVTSGSSSLTVNNVTNYAIPGMNVSAIGPGQSAVALVTVRNTGSTKLSTTVTSTIVTAQTNALADELSVTLTPATSCSPGLGGGVTGRLSTFTTTATPYVLPPLTSLALCLEVTMDLDAPVSTQNGTAAFTLRIDAAQVR